MIELHERLSEFSYSYGVTRETEKLLAEIGIRTTPFLPSLVHEAQLGFDVGFNRPGAVLLLQFMLGQSAQRFRRSNPADRLPILSRPFWRFTVNTAEPEGQYETLLKAEQDSAEAYYVAPRFVDWSEYLNAFESEAVLERSVLIRPSEVQRALDEQEAPDGQHRVIYDSARIYVCSAPVEVNEVSHEHLVASVQERISAGHSLLEIVHAIFDGLKDRLPLRKERDLTGPEAEAARQIGYELRGSSLLPRPDTEVLRRRRVEALRSRARSQEDAVAAALGIEAWSLGIQMIRGRPGFGWN
jgi:hypothetical protein